MGFAGNLRTLGLAEVFQTLARTKATGVLRLAADAAGRDVFFDQGEIIGVGLRAADSHQALLKRLILRGVIDGTTVAGISSGGRASQVVHALVERGSISADDVGEAYRAQAEDELLSLCTWERADFTFTDAGPDEPEASALIESARTRALKINLNSILMESARRSDEWARFQESVPDARTIYIAAGGHDPVWLTRGWPQAAVLPLIDGVRTVEEIVADTIAARFDVYAVLYDLIAGGQVRRLEGDELREAAEAHEERSAWSQAARLYRQVLAASPVERDTAARLAVCLEHLGDAPEAAACYGQLALEHLDDGDNAAALQTAGRAVELAPLDPRARNLLARCQVADGDQAAAVESLRVLAGRYLELGQLEDARGTCLKILELAPGDEAARRALARIFSRVEKDATAEDVVVCVQCSAVNHREATACAKCQANLRLSCLSCSRTVAVSDRICIFCGSDPHAGTRGTSRIAASPATSRILGRKTDSDAIRSGGGGWRDQLADQLAAARAAEQAGRYDEALTRWREVAKYHSDDAEIGQHVRALEARSHDQLIEEGIARGHALRRGRRFFGAVNAYRSALRGLGPNDQRRTALAKLLAEATKSRNRVAVLYGIAGVILLSVGALVAKPHVDLYRFTASAGQTQAAVDALAQTGGAGVEPVRAQLVTLEERLGQLRGSTARKAEQVLAPVHGAFTVALIDAARHDLPPIEAAVAAADPVMARQRLVAFMGIYGGEVLSPKIEALRTRIDELSRLASARSNLAAKAPELLAEAAKREADHDLAGALELARTVAPVEDRALKAKAEAQAERLTRDQAAFLAQVERARALGVTDVIAADAALAALQTAAEPWHLRESLSRDRAALQARRDAAATAWTALSSSDEVAALTAFVQTHAGTPTVATAQRRLSELATRRQALDAGLATWREQVRAQRWDDAWTTAHELVLAHGARVPAELRLSVRVLVSPVGATVTLGNDAVGTAPLVLQLAPEENRDLTVSAPGWQPLRVSAAEVRISSRWDVRLQRAALWQAHLDKPALTLTHAEGGALACAVDGIARIVGGRVAWKQTLGDDNDVDPSRAARQPLAVEGGWLVAGARHDVLWLNEEGSVRLRLPTRSEVRGRILRYRNDVFGSTERTAFAGEALFSGEFGNAPTAITLPAAALSGPLAVGSELDGVLVLADLRGRLLGCDESARRVRWDLDLQATDIGQLVAVPGGCAVVLDGSRLAVTTVEHDHAALRWSVRLNAPAVGEPLLLRSSNAGTAGGELAQAAGERLLRFTLAGVAAPPLALPSAATATAVFGGVIAVGCADGTLALVREGRVVWTAPGPAAITAVAVDAHSVLCAYADGAVVAYAP